MPKLTCNRQSIREADCDVEEGGERTTRSGTRFEWLAAFSLYLGFSIVFFGRGIIWHFSDYYVGRGNDPSLYMWCLAWWPHVIRDHLNPFFTDILWAPVGFNLAWATCFPLLGIVTGPLEMALGPVATFNVVMLDLPPLAGACAFWLCRRLTGRFVPALFAGFLFGFSPFVLGQLLSHLNQLLIFPIPILACLAAMRLDESIATGRFVGLFTLTLVVQFFLLLELFALTALVGAIAIALGLFFTSGETRRKVLAMLALVGVSYALATVAVSPYLYCYFQPGHPTQPLWSPSQYAADLLNFVIPTPANLLGDNRFGRAISNRFTGTLYDQCACLGLPLILIAVAWIRRHWEEPLAKTLALSLLGVCVLAAGPLLNVAGATVLPMPWLIVQRLPLITGAMPVRLMVFAFLLAAVIAALWLADPAVSPRAKWLGVAATFVMMLPNPRASYWVAPTGTPAFFLNGASRRMLSQSDIVLPLPFGDDGMCMLWQAESGMNYRMASGLTGLVPIQVRRWPVVNAFYRSWDLPEPETQLKAFIANLGITAIVLDDSYRDAGRIKKLLSLLDITPTHVSGVTLYRIPAGAFASYRSLSPIELERRAARIRFQTILRASAKYIAQGGSVQKLSLTSLIAAGLLPKGWSFDMKRNAFRDVGVGSWKKNLIAVGVGGTPSALKPLVPMYLPEADYAYFPFPHQLKGRRSNFLVRLTEPVPSGAVSGESFRTLIMAFTPEGLRAAARRSETAHDSSPAHTGGSAGAALSPAASPREVSR